MNTLPSDPEICTHLPATRCVLNIAGTEEILVELVIETNIKYSFQRVRDSRHGAHVQGSFHTICAKDIGTELLFLNIKESPETLMVRRLSFMKVLNLCFFEQRH